MTRLLVFGFLIATLCADARLKPEDCVAPKTCMVTTNWASIMEGLPEVREGQPSSTTTGVAIHRVEFNPPAGHVVRVLHLSGTFDAVVVGNYSVFWCPHVRGCTAGILHGMSSTAPEGSLLGTPMADNTFLYHQGNIGGGEPFTLMFDQAVDFTLEDDHVIIGKHAIYWSTLGLPIKLETSVIMTIQFVPETMDSN
ncbi:MAG TPA: hypothetical protein ENI05_09990 [Porticoccus sp.]|nr:hypothetical protein [Porticoccus sp.]